MIYDRLDRASAYVSAHEGLAGAIGFLSRRGISSWDDGRYDLSDGAYASLQSYDSKPLEGSLFESHQQYVDVQCVLEGEEWIYVSPPEALVVTQAYDVVEDCAIYRGAGEGSRILMRPGLFLLLFPHDAHMPCIALEAPRPVRKAVVKLPLRNRQG